MNEPITSQPVVVLTGAGASKFLGKATTFDVYDSKDFGRILRGNPLNFLNALREAMHKEAPEDPIDLEALLDKAEELNESFDKIENTPPYANQLGQASNVRKQLEEATELVKDFLVEYYSDIDAAQATRVYGALFDGLVAIAGNRRGDPVVPIFTLNYDEAVERASEGLSQYRLVDGFSGGYTPLWDPDLFERVDALSSAEVPITLFKLHGSVSWTRATGTENVERTIQSQRRRQGREHVLLYPTTRAKNIEAEPFATAYNYLKAALRNCSVAVFIGTSFRDKELIEVIRSRLDERGPPFTLIPVSPEANASMLAARIGYPENHISPFKGKFDESQLEGLLQHIKQNLDNAPPKKGVG